MPLKNITKERLIECLVEDPVKLRSQEDGAARFIKGFRLEAEKNRWQRRPEFEAWLIQFFRIPGAPTLNAQELRGVFKVFRTYNDLEKDLGIWQKLIVDKEVDSDRWVPVLLGLQTPAPPNWRRFRLEVVATLAQATSRMPHAHLIEASFYPILSLGTGLGKGKVVLSEHCAGKDSRLDLLLTSLILMVREQCDPKAIKTAAEWHMQDAVIEAQRNTIQSHRNFHQFFLSNMPTDALAIISADEFARLRWIYKRRPALFDRLAFEEGNSISGMKVYHSLFEEFQIPNVFKDRFFEGKMGKKELSLFEHVLGGKSLKDAGTLLPFAMTQSEIHQFSVFKDHGPLSVLESLLFIVLRHRTKDEAFAAAFVHRGERENLAGWLEILVKLYRIGLRKEHLQNSLDYIRAIHLAGVRNLLGIKSLDRFLLDVDAWHAEMVAAELTGTSNRLPSAGIDERIIENHAGSFKFRQLKTSHELYWEGKKLMHCVFAYEHLCLTRQCFIFSVTQRVAPQSWEKVLTLEVRDNCLVQARGLKNRAANEAEQEVIGMWARTVGYEVRPEVF